MSGPISKDGRSQWDGGQWVPIPPAPKAKLTVHNYFQIFLIVVVVVVALAIVASLVS